MAKSSLLFVTQCLFAVHQAVHTLIQVPAQWLKLRKMYTLAGPGFIFSFHHMDFLLNLTDVRLTEFSQIYCIDVRHLQSREAHCLWSLDHYTLFNNHNYSLSGHFRQEWSYLSMAAPTALTPPPPNTHKFIIYLRVDLYIFTLHNLLTIYLTIVPSLVITHIGMVHGIITSQKVYKGVSTGEYNVCL